MRTRARVLWARVRELFRRGELEADREDEFRFHLEMQVAHNLRRGMSEHEARRAALIAFGGVERFREETRETRGIVALENIVRDMRFAFRRLRRAPGFSVGVIMTVAIGTGATVAIGTLVHTVLLQPLPLVRAHELVHIGFRTPGLDEGREHAHSHASYVQFTDARSFAAIGAYHLNDAVNLTDLDDPQRVTAVMSTPGVLATLQVDPALGRLFSLEDALAEGTIPVLISHRLWQQRYGADSALIGRLIEINRRPRRVIGVLPPAFAFPTPAASVWFPLAVAVDRAALDSRYLEVVARLRTGVTAGEAEAELRALTLRLPERYPAITRADVERSGAHPEVQSLKDAVVAPVRSHLLVLALTMLFVLLIATANVVNLFLLRSEQLRHEVAITRALGGGASALARRFIIEGAAVGVAGGIVAVPLVMTALSTGFGFSQREIPRLHELTPGAQPIVVLLLLSLVIGCLVGVLAFARTRMSSAEQGMRASPRSVIGGGWRQLQQGLVATQLAVALALVLSASLLGRSVWNLRTADLGFEPGQRVAFEVTLPFRDYSNYAQTALFHDGVLARIRGIAGVTQAEAALEIPLIPDHPGELTLSFDAVGMNGRSERGAANVATPGYFDAMRIPLLHGRSFSAGDVASSTPAIVLSASLARALFGDVNVVGRLVRPPSPGDDDVFFRVVGVVGDVPRWRIEHGPGRMAYFPLLRDGDGLPETTLRIPILMTSARYVMRTDASAHQLAPAIRAAVRELDPRVPVTNVTSLPAMVDAATARVRLTMRLFAVAAGAAVLLGVVGIYSVVSYSVTTRVREFGVRLALGATPARIRQMIVRDGAPVAAFGIAAGVIAALWVARLARSLLYGVSASEPAVYLAATLLFAGIVTVATLVPARRAANVDPGAVMRAQ